MITLQNLLKIFVLVMSLLTTVNCKPKIKVPIGVILDMDTNTGKMINISISLALREFYEKHNDYTSVIVPHLRDSKRDDVEAASAAMDLMRNVRVAAILGPMTSSQADFVTDIGYKAKVPIVSVASSPSVSPGRNEYFVRAGHDSTVQLEPIAEVIKHFNWREVVFVYEDGEYGRGLVPYFSDSMRRIGAKVMYQTVVYPSVSDDWIFAELYKLKTMQTRVFVVHMLSDSAKRFFDKVKEVGMMEDGYVWIITEGLTSRLHYLGRKAHDSMQGVVGVMPHIPKSDELTGFESRWKREFRSRYPETDEKAELDISGIRLYDMVFGLAMALEMIGLEKIPLQNSDRVSEYPNPDLDAIGSIALETGKRLLPHTRNFRLHGLSGDFHMVNGQLQSSAYEILNIYGTGEKPVGFWSPETGITINRNDKTNGLKPVIWPGDSHITPKGWEVPTSNKNMLRIGVPVNSGFGQFINADIDPETGQVVMTGFCVDVFNAVIDALPYALKHEFIPFVGSDGRTPAGSYDDLVLNLSNGGYDAVIGDITILADRSDKVSFTLPYTEAGVSLVVLNIDERKSAWIFMKPLEKGLWITTGAFFVYTGFVVWVIERRVNKEFRGPAYKQIGMLLWFSFSTLVYAHREKLMSNLSRFVVIVWVFVVLVLTSSYTASLSSMLTVQQLQPAYTNITEIMRNGEPVGYQDGSFVGDMLRNMGFNDSQLKNYNTFEEYDNALKLGSKNGGVSMIVDENPYVEVFLAKYCTMYKIIATTNKTAGFGFAFPKGSSLVHDVSRAILQVTEKELMNITNHWFKQEASCDRQPGAKDALGMDSFKGVFLIAGLSSGSALLLFFSNFFYQNQKMLMSQDSVSKMLDFIAKAFDVFRENGSRTVGVEELNNSSSNLTSIESHQEEGILAHNSSLVDLDTIQVVQTIAI